MVVGPDDSVVGSVIAGCVESALVELCMSMLDGGDAMMCSEFSGVRLFYFRH
ncbi:hypothetical protein CHR55_33145 [Rhodococcus qingshengii]|uniref:XdhC- CoxI domain-containing protein n=1 Tax=Rhodococcus qingshengii TaxID=334542 RepID=A0A2A5IXJ7_RHOSG|nr:hypothetical protein CHR55_33145 [Rhodococcus qingshengii]